MTLKIDSNFLSKPLNKINYSKIVSLPVIKNSIQFNPTNLFQLEDRWYIAIRSESTITGKSKVLFYEKVNDKFILKKDFPKFNLEDPFITFINNKIIFGGVEIKKEKGEIKYRTLLYVGKSIFSLKLFFKSPYKMKDLRIVDLNGKIGVFTRPQGGIYNRGKIGFMILDSLSDLKKTDLYKASIIIDFDSDFWGGVNQAFVYYNKLCVVAHFSYVTRKNNLEIKHYVPVSFVYDYKLNKIKNIKILGFRKNFKNSISSSDIVFPGGISFYNNSVLLFVGVSDSKLGYLNIENPF